MGILTAFPGIQLLADTVRPVLLELSVLFGGIFGLYILLIIIRIYFERKKVHLLQQISADFTALNQHLGIHRSLETKGVFRKLLIKLRKRRK